MKYLMNFVDPSRVKQDPLSKSGFARVYVGRNPNVPELIELYLCE